MKRICVSALVAVAAITVAGSATAAQGSGTTVQVNISAEHLEGARPNGTEVTFRMKAWVEGPDASSLVGEGRHYGSGGAHNQWSVSGAAVGDDVTLVGVTTDSNGPYVGSPIRVEANASTNAITVAFGPLTGGPFVGGTVVTTGFGKVSIETIGN